VESPTVQELTKRAQTLRFKKLPFALSPVEIFSELHKRHETVYLLESMEGPQKLARYSFIGFEPRLTITVKNGVAVTRTERTGEEDTRLVTDPLSAIKQALRSDVRQWVNFRFIGGAVGYISYDAVRYWERMPRETTDDMDFPDVQMGVFDDGIVFDHKQNVAYYYSLGEDRYEEIVRLKTQPAESEALSFTQPRVNFAQRRFEKAVAQAKDYVRQGDIFQVVLSKRYDFHVKDDLIGFYRALRGINPSPYMYFFKAGDRQIIGSSPEMLVRVENRTVETFPIAGTRPIAKNLAESQRLARELLADPKERAEHVMLVDLARNDIGKIAEYGSVHVPEFMQVHDYSHVQHIVSRVVGDLRADCDSYDALKAVFPAGTVSGAPKPRAMEIIEELEPARRGPYAGAVGYFSYNGNADFAITIRTLFADGNKAHIQAGAGIVADSVPEREWFETEQKAQALFKALQVTGGERR
jgi:anthranilate synthase component 1